MFEDMRRVHTTENGYPVSRIEPPLNPFWDTLKQLRWKAAAARVDTGIDIQVNPAESYTKHGPFWVRNRGLYSWSVGRSAGASMTRSEMSGLIIGVELGAQAERDNNARSTAYPSDG